jgi:hypothetical protein
MNRKHHLIFELHLLILLLSYTTSHAQDIKIKETIRRSGEDTIVRYPVFMLDSKTASRNINDEIAKTMFGDDSLDSLLKTEDEVGLTFLSYSIILKTNSILSFSVDQEWMAAYPTAWSTYFSFNLKTGKKIVITDIIDSSDSAAFREMIFADKTQQLKKYKERLSLDFKNGNIEQEDYDIVIENVDECLKELSLDNFTLTESDIEIKDECFFPHAWQALGPDYNLKYSYASISNYMTSSWRELLIK